MPLHAGIKAVPLSVPNFGASQNLVYLVYSTHPTVKRLKSKMAADTFDDKSFSEAYINLRQLRFGEFCHRCRNVFMSLTSYAFEYVRMNSGVVSLRAQYMHMSPGSWGLVHGFLQQRSHILSRQCS